MGRLKITPAEHRTHKGDFLSPETRSFVMSRIRGKCTQPEILVEAELRALGINFEMHARDLPGRPDFVFRGPRVVVFVDGDFWHGRNFADWRMKLSEKWETKIATTIARDRRNTRALRSQEWMVVRIWERQLKADVARCVRRIVRACSH